MGGVATAFFGVYEFLTGEWLFYRMAPVCLLVDSLLSYGFFIRKDGSDSGGEHRESVLLFWKITAWKVIYIIFTLWLILTGSGRAVYNAMLNIMLAYYIYTLVIVAVALVRLLKRV